MPAPASTAPVDRVEPVPLAQERVPDAPVASKDGASVHNQDGSASAAVPAAATPPAQSGSAVRLDRVTVEFVQESWVELRDRTGKVVYSGNGAANTSRNFEAEGPLNVVIGNAPGVRITYNEKPVDVSAFTARNIARFTLE